MDKQHILNELKELDKEFYELGLQDIAPPLNVKYWKAHKRLEALYKLWQEYMEEENGTD